MVFVFRTINSIKLQGIHFYIIDINVSGNQGVKHRKVKFTSEPEMNPQQTTATPMQPQDASSTNHALLGTATGIVIFAIIVILIWFIRKKNRDRQENTELDAQQYSVSYLQRSLWDFS